MVVVVEALDGRILDGPVHPLDLAVGPWMVDLGEPVFNPVVVADPIKDVVERIFVMGVVCELDAIVGEYRVDGVGHGGHQIAQELRRNHLASLLVQLGVSELGRPIASDEQTQLSLDRLHLCDVDMKITNWVALECLLCRFVAFDVWQAGDAMTLQAPMQRRS